MALLKFLIICYGVLSGFDMSKLTKDGFGMKLVFQKNQPVWHQESAVESHQYKEAVEKIGGPV